MGIRAINGVEVGGDGFRTVARRGSAARDEMQRGSSGTIQRRTARAGGTEGGMSTCDVLRLRAAMKPISTVTRARHDWGRRSEGHSRAVRRLRGSRRRVVAEALVALVLAEARLEKFGGDSVDEWAKLEVGMRRDKKTRGSLLLFVVLEDIARPVRVEGTTEDQLHTAYAAVSS